MKTHQWLMDLSTQDFYTSGMILVGMTALGFGITNNDINLAAIFVIAKAKAIAFFPLSLFIALTWAVGEITLFMLSRFFGAKILKSSFYQKKMPDHVNKKIMRMMEYHSTYLLLILRTAPVIRAVLNIGLGSLGLNLKKYFSFYVPMLVCTIFIEAYIFYRIGALFDESPRIGWGVLGLWIVFITVIGRRLYRKIMI